MQEDPSWQQPSGNPERHRRHLLWMRGRRNAKNWQKRTYSKADSVAHELRELCIPQIRRYWDQCATAMRACVSAEAGNFHSKVGCGHSVEREIFPFTDFAIIGVNCLITIRCRDRKLKEAIRGEAHPDTMFSVRTTLLKVVSSAKINIQPDGKIRVGGSPARTLRVDAVNH